MDVINSIESLKNNDLVLGPSLDGGYWLIGLSKKLVCIGYKNVANTDQEGQWSRRGDIIDIFPVNNELPIRIEFFDNIIDKIIVGYYIFKIYFYRKIFNIFV